MHRKCRIQMTAQKAIPISQRRWDMQMSRLIYPWVRSLEKPTKIPWVKMEWMTR